MIHFNGVQFPPEMIHTRVRGSVAYPLSDRHVEALLEERGVSVDHATTNRGILTYRPPLEATFHRRKRLVWRRWRTDETDRYVKSEWRDLYGAVDTHGQTLDVLLTEQRDQQAALRLLTQTICRHRVPEQITLDGREANAAAIKHCNEESGTAIIIRQVKELNRPIEQDHRGVTRVTRPILGFRSFAVAQATRIGIERMHMPKKG
jgi:putative transposase